MLSSISKEAFMLSEVWLSLTQKQRAKFKVSNLVRSTLFKMINGLNYHLLSMQDNHLVFALSMTNISSSLVVKYSNLTPLFHQCRLMILWVKLKFMTLIETTGESSIISLKRTNSESYIQVLFRLTVRKSWSLEVLCHQEKMRKRTKLLKTVRKYQWQTNVSNSMLLMVSSKEDKIL